MTFINVLQSPSNIVPSLSDDDIYMIVVDSIKAYINKKISLQILVDIASKIQTFRGINETANANTESILEKLVSLSKYLSTEDNEKGSVDGILINIVGSISEKN